MSYRKNTTCRICSFNLLIKVLDLGETPIANNLYPTQALALDAPRFPLQLMRCAAQDCGLFQLSIAMESDVLYQNYSYATPNNPELRDHYARAYEWIEDWTEQFAEQFVVEIGSNNAAFLRYFTWNKNAEVLGVDPSPIEHDEPLPRMYCPFTLATAEKILKASGPANLIVARHCLAHIDDVHDVLAGVERLLAERGFFYLENAYWIDSMLGTQFDQIYHEHMSYFTLEAVQRLFDEHELEIVDVNFSDIHGGSFMVMAVRKNDLCKSMKTVDVPVAIRAERAWLREGLVSRFVANTASELMGINEMLQRELVSMHSVDAFGASAKAVTRFHAARIDHRHIRQCIDDSPRKQGLFMPGSGIPIVSPDVWKTSKPSAIYLTAWNYEKSFRAREKEYLANGGRFLT